MKKIVYSALLVFTFILTSCSSKQTLQEYYVANSENPNFISFDLPSSLLNLETANLTEEQRKAAGSLKKLNILAFKKTDENASDFTLEKAKVKEILKSDQYEELMKFNTSFGKATVKYLGKEDSIDEVIIYGDSEEKGFALVRVLGDNMNPAHLMTLIKAVEKSDIDGNQLKMLGNIFK
ncbi:DUF4252 domain-containing protein [Cellulophaga sp. HaHaR_3_176]|uniref:DUF4252 domain-containing protein n=1 Tax=Cellulophaga sp. HaHaR_3_176 TaxID=1942464 RepID=UPI001C1F9787|nr:DUF4252 domain-containing protein [Cellulophaga sp. HaHaR_3_176]QWX82616.1 DUF4252 domain-containing protein [Cellulophaga sp. HaHaR_3_176]